jgi:hypothetical protein
VANVIIEDPEHEDLLFAGLMRGVYVSTDKGSSWSILGKSMPMVTIGDMEIEPRSNDLVVATHGRGIYKLNLNPIHEHLANSKTKLFSNPTAYLPKKVDTHGDYSRKSYSKVPITLWSEKAETVELQVLDQSDSLIWSIAMDASKGFNQYRWDLITKRVESDSPYFVHYNQFIEPGVYKVILMTSDGKVEEELVVKPNGK